MSGRQRQVKAFRKEYNSPATSYLMTVLEKKARDETLQSSESIITRVGMAFQSLEEIIPHCGIYTPVLKLIREELLDAVYSDSYTTSKSSANGQSPKLERIPFFVLLQRLQDQRNETHENLQEQIEDLKKDVSEARQGIAARNEEITQLKAEIEEGKKIFASLEDLSNQKEEHIEMLMQQIHEEQSKSEEVANSLENVVQIVQDKNSDLKSEANMLRRYKVAYDTLKDTFDLPPDKRPRRGFRRPVISTKKTQLLSSIEAASKLEQQIIEVQTKSLEEYDQYLEEVKSQLSQKHFSENEADTNFFNEELQLESLGDEMSSKLKNFQRLISSAVTELELVRQHRDTLQSQLSQMEQAENLAGGDAGSNAGTLPPSSMAGGPGSSRMMTHDDTGKKTSTESQFSLESGLEEDTTPLVDPTTDPFNPQERLLSKYSAMIYTSVNSGKTFDEIAHAKFCVSCGEKTAICPHKITKSDLVVTLPNGCTHIKLSRPMVRVSLPTLQAQGSQENDQYAHHHGRWYDPIPEDQHWDSTAEETSDALSVRRQLAPLWQDAKRQAGMDVMSSSSTVCATRELTLQRVHSLLEQFYASIIWRDEHAGPEDETYTFKGYMYNFMSERYQEEEISPMATYDLVTAVVKYAAQDKTVLVLGLSLAGIFDGCVPRYIHLVADLIDQVDWQEVSDFATFAEVLYPFLHEDDAEMLAMEYVAFSENKISKTLVMNYIIHITTRNKEPRILDAEANLANCGMKEKGLMTNEEFLSAMEAICPLASDSLIKRLSYECMLTLGYTTAPIKKLACIVAYVSFLQVATLLKGQIGQRVLEARKKNMEGVTKLHTAPSLVPEKGNLITMTQVKLLAENIARQRQAGNRPSQQSFDDDLYWHSRPNTRDSLF